MRFFSSFILNLLAIVVLAAGQELDYLGSLQAFAYGKVEKEDASGGSVWFDIPGFSPDKLPLIQNNVGVYTLDNFETLKTIAGLGRLAAKKGKWGDLVYLHNVFAMNGHADYTNVASNEMRDGLLAAVTKSDGTTVDSDLVDLYMKTSSSPALVEAFNALRTSPVTSITARWTRETCSRAHQAIKSQCRALAENIHFNASIKSGGPRSICRSGCCISWSANATFQLQNLYPAANYCINACGSASVSCEVYGVSLQGTIVDQCLSNRATGCK